jgi:hypothetical protein
MNMTGTKAQLYNGLCLIFTFFGCRLVWGTYQSARVYYDMWHAIQASPDAGYVAAAHSNSTLANPDENVMAFASEPAPIPVWLAGTYVASNIVLNGLNWHWFFKMIAAIRKRFETPKEVKEKVAVVGTTKGETTGAELLTGLRQRRHSIEDVVPDTDDLREGTIQ